MTPDRPTASASRENADSTAHGCEHTLSSSIVVTSDANVESNHVCIGRRLNNRKELHENS
jgi:hypothetical protein